MNPNSNSAFTGDPSAAAHYVCKQIAGPIQIDGDNLRLPGRSSCFDPALGAGLGRVGVGDRSGGNGRGRAGSARGPGGAGVSIQNTYLNRWGES